MAELPLLPAGSSFHHIGLACRDLDRELEGLRPLGYAAVGERFTDPAQGVTGLFIEGLGPRIELLSPIPGSTVLDPWLAGRAKMYHLGYEVTEFDAAVAVVGELGGRIASQPRAAIAFEMRRVCFVLLRTVFLVELIEAAQAV
jgi:catechol 2,3-dioxygenase-like lactoylglutathione lyase family enzyme